MSTGSIVPIAFQNNPQRCRIKRENVTPTYNKNVKGQNAISHIRMDRSYEIHSYTFNKGQKEI